MGSMRVVVTVFLFLASIVANGTEAAVSCRSVEDNIVPCLIYAGTNGTIPLPDSCCNGLRMIKEQVDQSESDRQSICVCINSALNRIRPKYIKIIASVPGACGVDLKFKIDPSTDCNRI